MRTKLKELLNIMTNTLFPETYSCIICDDDIKVNRYGLCDSCGFTALPDKLCKICGTPINNESDYCLDCPEGVHNFSHARGSLMMDNKLHRLIHALKYGEARWIAKYLGMQMCDIFIKLDWDIDVIIPVPLYKTRQKKRGYNQSAELAAVLSENFNIPLNLSVLEKIRDTNDQASLTREERIVNLKDAFKVTDTKDYENKNILIVDDVITTATTIDTCALELKRLKPKSIFALSLAIPSKLHNQH